MINVTTSADVRNALHRRFPAKEYVCIEEAPTGPLRNGGIDFVAISCWSSRKYEIDAFEIKVSYSDWKNERAERDGEWIGTAKNWWWTQHAHRFWIACPTALAPRIAPELPTGWGLLSIGDVSSIYVKPSKIQPDPLGVPAWVGLLRTLGGASYNALDRAYDKGYSAAKSEMASVEGNRTFQT